MLLVVDAGSSGVRASLFDATGHCLRRARRDLAIRSEGARAELGAAALWAAVLDAVAALGADAASVGAIGVTAALGMLLADAEGVPLTDIVTWQDRRARTEAAEFVCRAGGAAHLQAVAGRRVAPDLLAPLLLWFARHRPALLAGAEAAPSVKDWLVRRLCGAHLTDPTSASYSLLCDVVAGEWSAPLVAALGPAPPLPPIRDAATVAGGLRAEVAARCGLTAGTPVIVGGPDGTVAGIGAGMVRPGIAIDVMGTTDVVSAYVATPVADAAGRLVLNRFPVGRAWTLGGPLAATGGAVAWLLGLLGQSAEALTEAARGVSAGVDGLAFLPNFAGARAPRWNPGERGTLHGIGFDHGAPHLFRALLEGCAAEVAEVFDTLAASGVAVEEVRGVGGGTANALWLDIRASMLGRPIALPAEAEASALGTAMLAAVAVGLLPDLAAAAAAMTRQGRVVAPVAAWAEPYRALRARHAALRQAVAAEDG